LRHLCVLCCGLNRIGKTYLCSLGIRRRLFIDRRYLRTCVRSGFLRRGFGTGNVLLAPLFNRKKLRVKFGLCGCNLRTSRTWFTISEMRVAYSVSSCSFRFVCSMLSESSRCSNSLRLISPRDKRRFVCRLP
jgi:hypothetical protein